MVSTLLVCDDKEINHASDDQKGTDDEQNAVEEAPRTSKHQLSPSDHQEQIADDGGNHGIYDVQ